MKKFWQYLSIVCEVLLLVYSLIGVLLGIGDIGDYVYLLFFAVMIPLQIAVNRRKNASNQHTGE